jgi:hypothetical protein
MAWVWTHSRSKPTQRLVLLAIADCANDRGAEAYPSNATLADKTGLTDRAVRRCVVELEQLSELSVEYKAGPRGTNRYRVIMAEPQPDQTRTAKPGTRNMSPGTRNVSHPDSQSGYPDSQSGYPDSQSGYPDGGSPEPSEPSENHPEPSNPAPAPPAQPPESDRPEVDQLCQHLADRIEANGSKRPTITKRWRTAARLMIDNDHHTADQVRRAIDWCQTDEFWRTNILSMPKLRQQYDRLRLAAQRNGARASPRPSTTDQRVAQAAELVARLEAQQAKEIQA